MAISRLPSRYKSITYYISDDGKSKDMQVYSGKGLNGADFASKEDLKVGQKVTIEATESTDWVYDTIRKICGGDTQ